MNILNRLLVPVCFLFLFFSVRHLMRVMFQLSYCFTVTKVGNNNNVILQLKKLWKDLNLDIATMKLMSPGASSDLVTYVEIPSTLYPKFPLALSTAALCHSAW